MKCPTCAAELAPRQRFCHTCGTNVEAITLPAPPAGPLSTDVPTTPSPQLPDPPQPLTAPPSGTAAPPTVAASAMPAPPTGFEIVEQTTPINRITGDHTQPILHGSSAPPEWDAPFAAPLAATAAVQRAPYDQAAYDDTAQHSLHADPMAAPAAARQSQLIIGPSTSPVPRMRSGVGVAGRGSTVLAVFAGVAGVATIIAAFLPVLRVSTDAPIPEVGDYQFNDVGLGTNVVVGLVIAGVVMLVGGLLATRGFRLGAGLVAGAALALVPVIVVVWGGIDFVAKVAETHAVTVAAAGEGGSVFSSKQGFGLWVLIGAVAIGLIAGAVSLLQAGPDGRPRLSMVIGLLGALAAVFAAGAQMIPGPGRALGDNFDNTLAPSTVVYGRLALIGVVAAVGAIGFLSNTRWGVGFALGGLSFWAWQWVSSIAELGHAPGPPGFVLLSTDDGKPHVGCTIGVILVLALAAIAVLTAPRPKAVAP